MKITFLSIVFLIFSFSGLVGAGREKRRIDNLGELLRLIIYIKTEIYYYRRELREIYLNFESPILDKSGFSRRLGDGGFAEGVKHLHLDRTGENALLEFSKDLGMLPPEEQCAAAERCITILRDDLTKMRLEYPQKRKLYISFGVMFGALIFIIGI